MMLFKYVLKLKPVVENSKSPDLGAGEGVIGWTYLVYPFETLAAALHARETDVMFNKSILNVSDDLVKKLTTCSVLIITDEDEEMVNFQKAQDVFQFILDRDYSGDVDRMEREFGGHKELIVENIYGWLSQGTADNLDVSESVAAYLENS